MAFNGYAVFASHAKGSETPTLLSGFLVKPGSRDSHCFAPRDCSVPCGIAADAAHSTYFTTLGQRAYALA